MCYFSIYIFFHNHLSSHLFSSRASHGLLEDPIFVKNKILSTISCHSQPTLFQIHFGIQFSSPKRIIVPTQQGLRHLLRISISTASFYKNYNFLNVGYDSCPTFPHGWDGLQNVPYFQTYAQPYHGIRYLQKID